jgi:MFS family permease
MGTLFGGNFRLFIGGQSVSLVGTFMQQVAMSWLVYRLSHSTFDLGVVTFVSDVAGVSVTLFGGLLVDRANPHRIVLGTQSLAMLQALVLAGLAFTNHLDITGIIFLSACFGAINGVDIPARQVFVMRLVPLECLGNAIVLTSLVLDGARLIGPSVASAVAAGIGEWLCFLLNAATYAVLIAALLMMRIEHYDKPRAAVPLGTSLQDGIAYSGSVPTILPVLLLVALVGFSGGPYAALMPVMAADVLGGGVYTLGLLMGSIGVGALAAAVFLCRRQKMSGYTRLIGLGAGLFGVNLTLFALSTTLFFSIPLLAMAGLGVMILMACSHTYLLTVAEEEMRGRVMSLFTLSFMATVPLGSLCAGAAASFVGAPKVIAIGGSLCVLGAIAFLAWMKRDYPDCLQARATGLGAYFPATG